MTPRVPETAPPVWPRAIVGAKIKGNRFVIKTNAPNVEVSWQVTGVRQDAFAKKHRLSRGSGSQLSFLLADPFFQLLEQLFPDLQLAHHPRGHRLGDHLPGAAVPPATAHRHFSLQ